MAIETRALTKSFGTTVAIADLNLTVEHGEVIGFLGANGAGKTTALRCLLGLLRPTNGTVRILDMDPLTEHNKLMSRVGYLPGELRLYEDLTGHQHLQLLENLQSAPITKRKELCERFALSHKDLSRPIREYSRGMKQKIGLVQAFQHSPKVALLDEPTEGLDPLIQHAFFDLLKDQSSAGNTVLLSSHVMSEVERSCQRAAVIKQGRLMTVDTIEALRNAHSRQIRFTFKPDIDPTSIGLREGWRAHWSQNVLSLTLPAGEVVKALKQLLSDDIVDVVTGEATLDEAVVDLYRSEEQ